MAARSFIYTDSVSVSGNASGTIVIAQGATEKGEIRSIIFDSTGAFQIEEIRDSSGTPYTNASSADPIPSTLLKASTNMTTGKIDLPVPIALSPNLILYITVKDTSGSSNTIRFIGYGTKEPA
jgi:hypothetical protein